MSNDSAWYAVGTTLAKQVERWSGRDNVIVSVAPGKGGATALYQHDKSEIEINPDVCFPGMRPEDISDYSNWRSRIAAPVGCGALYHESMHARHSVPTMEYYGGLSPAGEVKEPNADLIMDLEEGRIETIGAKHNTGFRTYLRASTLEVAFKDAESPEKSKHLQVTVDEDGKPTVEEVEGLQVNDRTLALIAARTEAKILKMDDLTVIREALVDTLGQELHDTLWGLAVEYSHLRDDDFENMSRIAAEWRKHSPAPIQIQMSGDELGDLMDEILDSMGDNAKDIQAQGTRDRDAEESNEKTRKMKDRDKKRKTFQKISSHTVTKGATRSRLVQTRRPSRDEQAAMASMARELDKARYRDRQAVRTSSTVKAPASSRFCVVAAIHRPAGAIRVRAVIDQGGERIGHHLDQAGHALLLQPLAGVAPVGAGVGGRLVVGQRPALPGSTPPRRCDFR